MRRFGMPMSDDTILRHLKRGAAGLAPPAKVIGLDDWSWRKSWRYGTIIVDLERRAVVDILEDRSVESAANWLRKNPSIGVVSRDRCGLYAQAVREGAPQAIQVADRFHLVQNFRLAVEEQMNLSGRSNGRSILSEKENVDAAAHRRHAGIAHRQSRDEVFATIHALRDEGLTYCEIERRTGYKRRTVSKWLNSRHHRIGADGRSTQHRPGTSSSSWLNAGRTEIGADATCSMMSSSEDTPAAVRTWSGCSERGAGPTIRQPISQRQHPSASAQ